jgi:hypothetical protein
MDFYAYLWLREDYTPYYAGKGKGDRGFSKENHKLNPPEDKSLIIILPMISEEEALEYERRMIAFWGRKDLGTGCLRNFTDGGDGMSGYKVSPETLLKKSFSMKGKNKGKRSKEICQNISKSLKGRVCWNKGKRLTKEHRMKMSLAHKELGDKPPSRLGCIPWNKGNRSNSN